MCMCVLRYVTVSFKSVFSMVMYETRFCQTTYKEVMTIALTDQKFSFYFFFFYFNKKPVFPTELQCQKKKKKREMEKKERKTFPYNMATKRRIWFLLHLFFLSSGGFAFRHLTGSLRKGIRSICGFPTVLCVWSFPRRCFMNT